MVVRGDRFIREIVWHVAVDVVDACVAAVARAAEAFERGGSMVVY